MEACVAVAKVGKYATSESGDTLEMIERPGGGLSFVLSDGQRSGKAAKAISNVVARKAISLLADGVRDGAAARAASDYLYTYRSGKVLATLNLLSIDLETRTMVIARNNPAPVLLCRAGDLLVLDDPCLAIGSRRGLRPAIQEFPLELGLAAVVFTDGLVHAGERAGRPMDVLASVRRLMNEAPDDPHLWADSLLDEAIQLDDGRPADDISLLVAAIRQARDRQTRRLVMRVPI